ncbi:hypothetical protein [Kitasatospora sp. NPDC087271]|uniref:hypothetical protein n=1 Tax=Kitasatospora sp. NPDC087271 TaxID=3364067 RepID=UPI00382C9A3C
MTELSPSWGWAAGDMISDVRDLNTFFAAQQREMFTMVPTGHQWIDQADYALGVAGIRLDCGPTVWGMGGAINGSWSYALGTRDGRHLLATNVNGDWVEGSRPIAVFTSELEAESCPRS